jgi:peptide deformylase
MRVPIIAYGNSVLREPCLEVEDQKNSIQDILMNLKDTLDLSGGVGLAAPQINSDYRIFVVHTKEFYQDLTHAQRQELFSGDQGITEFFINARLVAESEDNWDEMEGCLSIPGIQEPVTRSREIIMEYLDEEFQIQRKQFSGYTAKVIQHEYDHINGLVFIDHLCPLKKKLLQAKLKRIIKGKLETTYPIKFANKL